MDNRENILAVALRLFSSMGYEAVGVQMIVDEAGITKPTLYHYFGSKRGLLDALLEEYFNVLIQSVRSAAEYYGDLPQTLQNVAEAFFLFAKQNKDFYRMQLAMCFSGPESETLEACSKYNRDLINILTEMFIHAAENHGNMKGRHQRYAFTFLGIINNYITLFLGNHIKLDSQAAFQAVHQFSHGIYS
ncbi:MAG: TetR/AcrR family transcriptional regulator [Bacteroidota bacterium]|jgi:TetR/AcrR family transcriptional regulator|nr:TetR/AcrR family transcriptional regulator [Ignavibacteria bacterium]MCU7500707.1 TetR/AcrR family transcriptional regulator [Ignavibacteria bacterium]MCU7522306.1 TetR/AcrR family transcriptional regulator [Ignavibacteria bacterium]MCU7525565.1 TetR/AcrR family transcriptional regulator [Ignavibacteria bacterium]HEX2961355.1 TetR/AcrR family transcriptional regulator [Ignavibacteriales bacterium]